MEEEIKKYNEKLDVQSREILESVFKNNISKDVKINTIILTITKVTGEVTIKKIQINDKCFEELTEVKEIEAPSVKISEEIPMQIVKEDKKDMSEIHNLRGADTRSMLEKLKAKFKSNQDDRPNQ